MRNLGPDCFKMLVLLSPKYGKARNQLPLKLKFVPTLGHMTLCEVQGRQWVQAAAGRSKEETWARALTEHCTVRNW
jgi:hypothetical protein